MPSYLVTGASRGLGYEFLRQFSADPSSTVIGLVRDKKSTEEKIASTELKRDNIHIFQADLTDYESIKKAVQDVSDLTGGSLDYVIANAAYLSPDHNFASVEQLAADHKLLERELLASFNTNVIGNVNLFNLVIPLVLKGNAKKVIAISSGVADDVLTAKYDLESSAPYAISKAGLNTAVAKFSAQYRKDGVLFLSISPGVVDTFDTSQLTASEQEAFQAMGAKFAAYAPHWTGPLSPEDSVKAVMSVVEKASVEAGDGGSFLSHKGNKEWL